PIVPITDLTIKNDNLIAATQGRSFWLIDDLTPLHQLNDNIAGSNFHLYKPKPGYRMPGGQARTPSKTQGKNHPEGIMIHFFVKDTTGVKASLEILEASGTLIKKYATKPDKKTKDEQLKIKPGMNRFDWNMRYADAEGFDGLIMWAARLTGPKAAPGSYKAKLTINDKSMETEFEILKDPRTVGTQEDIKAQFDFLIAVRNKLSDTHKAIKKIRTTRDQINRVTEGLKDKADMKDVTTMAKWLQDDMKKIEEALYQTKNKSGQDPLNFPVRLNNKLAALASEADGSDYRPTEQVKAVFKEITGKIDEQLAALEKIFTEQIPKFNDLVRQKNINAVSFAE
ncbi:MAG: glycosyl hydrolase, partial [Bacteroidota bacterium]